MIASLATIVILAVSPVQYVTDRLAPVYQTIQRRLFNRRDSDESKSRKRWRDRSNNNQTPTDPGENTTPEPTSPSGPTTAPGSINDVTDNAKYNVHASIPTTVFWAGEGPGEDNSFITNVESAWDDNWVRSFGGVDKRENRNGFLPGGFTPKENPFYFALPFSDYGNNGPKSDLSMVPWATGALMSGQSILKNRWIAIEYNGKVAYAQWEDVGPYNEDDAAYVFGTAGPRYKQAGLDISPAVADFLGFGDTGKTSWRFVDASQVPEGEWKKIVTTSQPNW